MTITRHCNTLQRTATTTNTKTLQHTARRCNNYQYKIKNTQNKKLCNILQQQLETLQHTATTTNTWVRYRKDTMSCCFAVLAAREERVWLFVVVADVKITAVFGSGAVLLLIPGNVCRPG